MKQDKSESEKLFGSIKMSIKSSEKKKSYNERISLSPQNKMKM